MLPDVSKNPKRSQSLTVQRERRERAERKRKLNRQRKDAAIRAKYGPTGRPAPVTVKTLDGEVLKIVDQSKYRKKVYADLLEDKAREASYGSYAAYLQSGHWRALRLRALNRDGFRCRSCGSKRNLAVHHRWYVVLGAEHLSTLETLCGKCHRKIHR